MKQYCRYCANCIYGDVVWCDELEKIISEASAKTVNHCKHFVFNEIDAFNFEHKYKPIQKKEKVDNGQLELFEDSADK
jgi:hypothetical protein